MTKEVKLETDKAKYFNFNVDDNYAGDCLKEAIDESILDKLIKEEENDQRNHTHSQNGS